MDSNELKELFDHASNTNEILHAISNLSSKIDLSQRKSEEAVQQQKKTDCRRFWATFIVTLIGSIAAIGGLIATIVLR